MNMEDKTTVLVLSGKVARRLLREGYTIVDIKAMKENKDRTVFIFKIEDGILKSLHK